MSYGNEQTDMIEDVLQLCKVIMMVYSHPLGQNPLALNISCPCLRALACVLGMEMKINMIHHDHVLILSKPVYDEFERVLLC